MVKFTGDGFFAVWPFSNDFRMNAKVCQMAERAAITLSNFVNLARLDLKMNNDVFLKQGIAIEPNALNISYTGYSGAMENDYIGKMINCAFRIVVLPDSYPYIAAHKEFIEVMNMYGPTNAFNSYKKMEVDDEVINRVFKGVKAEADQNYAFSIFAPERVKELAESLLDKDTGNYDAEIKKMVGSSYENLKSHPNSLFLKFFTEFHRTCKNGPEWLRVSYLFNWALLHRLGEMKTESESHTTHPPAGL